MSREEIRILIIEDNPADIFLLKEALQSCCTCKVQEVEDGDKAWRILDQAAQRNERPDLVILDLNLPGRDGVEILGLIRDRPELREAFVAVVSSSPQDIIRQKAAQANCYMTKSSDLAAFLRMGEAILTSYHSAQCTPGR